MLIVSDTSPLTALLQIGRADILPLLFSRILIPSLANNQTITPDFKACHPERSGGFAERSRRISRFS